MITKNGRVSQWLMRPIYLSAHRTAGAIWQQESAVYQCIRGGYEQSRYYLLLMFEGNAAEYHGKACFDEENADQNTE